MRYLEARAAAAAGADERASAAFAEVLDASPDNQIVAAQALDHGVAAGDWPLALRAARILENAGQLRPDIRLLLVADAFKRRDWATARRQIDVVVSDRVFAFAVPVLRAWLAFASRRGDPIAALGTEIPPGGYAEEHRALLAVAMGRRDAGQVLAAATGAQSLRAIHLRVAGAGALAARGDRAGALALLQGDEPPLVAARALVEARRPVPGSFEGANSGLAELLVRIALDLDARGLTSIGLGLSRVAGWVDPASSEPWMVASELLAKLDMPDKGIAALGHVSDDDPFAFAVSGQRARLLVAAGETEQALGLARARAEAPGAGADDWVRLGDVLMALDRPAEAARAFARALEAHGGQDRVAEWQILFAQGGALDRAGDWPAARAALERASRAAPNQPLVLNYLGYGLLIHHEDLAEGERLVREAHRLAPDNPAITDSLGWALYLKGDRQGAIALLETAARGAPADVEINEHLGDAYYSVGRRIEARFAWRAARVYAEGEDATRIDAKIANGLRMASVIP